MLTDEEIENIAAQNKSIRDEERDIQRLIELAEKKPELFDFLQPICDFLNQFEISIGGKTE